MVYTTYKSVDFGDGLLLFYPPGKLTELLKMTIYSWFTH